MSNNNNQKQNGNKPEVVKAKLEASAFEVEPLKASVASENAETGEVAEGTQVEVVNTAKLVLPDAAKEVETVFVAFNVPQVPAPLGADTQGASYGVLAGYAKRLNDHATKLFDGIKEKLETVETGVRGYGEGAGKLESESDDDYARRVATLDFLNSTARVSMPVSVIFGDTIVAMVRSLCSGSVNIAKFKDFILSGALLKKATEQGNFGKEDKALVTSHGSFLFGVRAVGVDTNGRLKAFYEIAVKAVSAVMLASDEARAIELIAHLESKTGVKREVLHNLVQFMIIAQVARECRKQAKVYSDKAIEANQVAIAERADVARADGLKIAMTRAESIGH